jgi:hypothetical protein
VLALLVGTILALGALAFVLYPLFAVSLPRPRRPVATPDAGDDEAVAALREIEFDRETGKLSPDDYEELRARYTQRALDAMRRKSAAANASPDELLEAEVAAFRARLRECATCGPRPEPDALYCSNCGTYLPGQCASCGADVHEKGAGYCASCGRSLAA